MRCLGQGEFLAGLDGAYASAEYVTDRVQACVGVETVTETGITTVVRKNSGLTLDPDTMLITKRSRARHDLAEGNFAVTDLNIVQAVEP